MKYHKIEPMCRIHHAGYGSRRGCPHDGLGCIGGDKCSINSKDGETRSKARNADKYGPDFHCVKRESAKLREENGQLRATTGRRILPKSWQTSQSVFWICARGAGLIS